MPVVIQLAVASQVARAHLRVAVHLLAFESLTLTRARMLHTPTNHRRALTWRRCFERPIVHGRDLYVQIDPIQQRATDPASIALDLLRVTATGMTSVAKVAAGTRVHRCHQHQTCGIGDSDKRARDRDEAVLQRLTKHLQHRTAELGQLIEKEYTVVRQRHLPWTGKTAAAAHHPHLRDRVVRRSKGTLGYQPRERLCEPRHRVHAGGLQRLLKGHRRKDRWKTTCKHRLSGARWTDHQQVMPASRCDLEGSTRTMLATNIGEVRVVLHLGHHRLYRPWRRLHRRPRFALKKAQRLLQATATHDLRVHHQRRLLHIVVGNDHATKPLLTCTQRQGEHTADGAQLSLKRELASDEVLAR